MTKGDVPDLSLLKTGTVAYAINCEDRRGNSCTKTINQRNLRYLIIFLYLIALKQQGSLFVCIV